MIKKSIFIASTLFLGVCSADCCDNPCNSGWEVSLGVSVLKAGGYTSLPIAVSRSTLDTEGWQGKLYTPSFDWSPGWEAKVTKNLGSGASVNLRYMGFHFQNKNSAYNTEDGLHLIWSGGENFGSSGNTVTTDLKMNGTNIGLFYQDNLASNCHSLVQWYGGLNYYYLDSTVLAKSLSNDSLEHFTKNNDTNHLIGPATGLIFNYSCNECSSLYLDTNLTLAYNSHEIHRIEGPLVDVDAPMDFHYRFNTVIPVIGSAIGVRYSFCGWDFSAEYGFKWFNHIFDSAQQFDDTNDAAGCATPHDFTLQGITFRLGNSF